MAATPDAVLVDEIENLLICSICLGTLNDPRTLPCFHSFCKCCLEQFVKTQREKAVADSKEIEDFKCPICKSVFTLKPKQEVEGMPVIYFIRNMAIQRRAKVAKCSRCEEPSSCWCVTCEQFMCDQCLGVHSSFPNLKKHTVLSINELSRRENQEKVKGRQRCREHKDKKLKFYCETCGDLICRDCTDFSHEKPDHVYFPIEKVAEKQREALKLRFTFLEEKLEDGNKALQAILHATEVLNNNAASAKVIINRQKEKVKKVLLHTLEEKAQITLNEVDQMYDKTHERLTTQINELLAFMDKVKGSFHLSKNLLETGNNEEIITSEKMMEASVEIVKRECPKNMKPVHDGNIQYRTMAIDVANLTEVLGTLGKVVCHPAENRQAQRILSDASIILKDKDEYVNQMVEWLDDQFMWRLCYRASRDGWKAENFHTNCDDKGRTVTVVKVDDYIFGGFTDESWGGTAGCKLSGSAFMFSLKNKDNLTPFKAPINKDEDAITTNYKYGPVFGRLKGGADLCIVHEAHNSRWSYTNFGRTYKVPDGYQCGNGKTQSLLAGSYYFSPSEIEVFY